MPIYFSSWAIKKSSHFIKHEYLTFPNWVGVNKAKPVISTFNVLFPSVIGRQLSPLLIMV